MDDRGISRRRFLTAVGGGVAAVAVGGLARRGLAAAPAAPTTAPAAAGKGVVRDGGLVTIPDSGELYIASDFHTRHTDFKQWLTRTDLVAKLKDRQDVYGLILGDAVDAKFGDPQAEPDGDSRIIDRIREIQQTMGPAGKRLIFIRGNHEHGVAQIYGQLQKQYNLNPSNRDRLVRALFASANGEFYAQFNFLKRITPEQFAYLQQLPLAVLTGGGVLGVHAGPSKSATAKAQVVAMDDAVSDEMLWSRPGADTVARYMEEDVARFLRVMDNAQVMLSGHTPLSIIPPEWLRDGVGVYGTKQLILATSFGSEPGEKSYLKMDLGKHYGSVADLKPGAEILPLQPKANA